MKSFFATPIYYENLDKTRSNKRISELLLECKRIEQSDKAGQEWSKKNYVGGYTSYSSYDRLHIMSPYFAELKESIDLHVLKFAKHLEMDVRKNQISMTQSWINIMPKQTTHSMHIHPLSFISGTYYIQTPKNCSGIKFEDPRLSKMMFAPPKKQNVSDRNQQIIRFPAQAGKLVLFESWLRHEVEASTNDENRISFSFNYSWL